MAISKITSASLDQSAGAPSWDASGNTTLTGNLTISGTGKRITGDFSNATVANRVAFQTSTTDGSTSVSLIPNGIGTVTGLTCFNNSDPTNAGFIGFVSSTTESRIQASKVGTGTYLPLTMYTGGSERLRIDTAGKVGIGNSSPYAGLDLGKYGTAWNSDYQYSKPAGNVFVGMAAVSSQDNWFGFTGAYGASTGSANILLQANYLDVGHQGGNYVGSEATGTGQAALTFGKVTSAGTVNGNASKTEFMRIDSAGILYVGNPGTMGLSADNTSAGIAVSPTGKTQICRTASVNTVLAIQSQPSSGLSYLTEYIKGNTSVGYMTATTSGLTLTGINGLSFTSTQNPSSDANTLDDYEEGSWTPAFGFTSGSVTYSSQFGRYTKVGNVVNVAAEVFVNTASTPTGQFWVTGLPFAPANGNLAGVHTVRMGYGLGSFTYMCGEISSSARIYFAASTTNVGAQSDCAQIVGNGFYVRVSATYLSA